MAHEFEKGYSVREPAWHGLATVIDHYPGREEAIKLAGHDFQVIENPVFSNYRDTITGIEGWKAIIRSDTEKAIAIVRDSYTVVQNDTLWDLAEAIVNEPNMQYETAGVLRGGAILWVLIRLNTPYKIKGDNSEIVPYCQLSTGHDGSEALCARAHSVRTICMNTYRIAADQANRTGRVYSFKHSKNVMNKVEEARSALQLVQDSHQEFIELANELADHTISKAGIEDFLTQFIPMPIVNMISDRVKNNILQAREKVMDILDGETIADAHKRTSYGLWCAGVEYLDHYRRFNTEETYFRRTMFDFVPAKAKLAKLALQVS